MVPPSAMLPAVKLLDFMAKFAFGQATNQLLFNKKQKRQSSGTLAKKVVLY
jgi:hypothetical protein